MGTIVSLAQPELSELQHAFCTAARTQIMHGAALGNVIVEAGLAAELRLGIYRNNTTSNLRNALQADFPVVEKLVGEDFFRHVADVYIAATPSTSGDINDYGEAFPEFLATFPSAASLPYLCDVARLERAWKQSFFAADAVVGDMDFSGMDKLPPENLCNVRFHPHPALRLLSSPYPVLQIWIANQPGAASSMKISLDAGAEKVLLRRPIDQVEMQPLAPAEYAWLSALAGNGTLAESVDAAFAEDESFELGPCLQQHMGQGNLIGYSTEAEGN